MNKKCKNCGNFRRADDGTCKCYSTGVMLASEANEPTEAHCWTRKPPITSAELSRIRSLAGAKGGASRGYGTGGTPMQQTCLRKMDHDVLKGYAEMKEISLAETVHRLCKSLIAKYPQLQTNLWRD